MDVKTKICDKKGRKGEASKAGRGKEGFIIKGTTHCGNFPPLRTKVTKIFSVMFNCLFQGLALLLTRCFTYNPMNLA